MWLHRRRQTFKKDGCRRRARARAACIAGAVQHVSGSPVAIAVVDAQGNVPFAVVRERESEGETDLPLLVRTLDRQK